MAIVASFVRLDIGENVGCFMWTDAGTMERARGVVARHATREDYKAQPLLAEDRVAGLRNLLGQQLESDDYFPGQCYYYEVDID